MLLPSQWNEDQKLSWQVQWDSFFKVLAPKSNVIRSLVEEQFKLPRNALSQWQQMPSDMSSRRVAQALHQTKPWKELRGDGFFRPETPYPVVGYEYQSTENTGMLLRTFMYGEAFDETFGGELDGNNLEFVVLYSGNDMGKAKAREKHNKIEEKVVRHLFLDLNQISAGDLENDNIYSRILRLSRRDANDFGLFWQAAAEIDSLSDATERLKLRTALIVAAMNKPATAKFALELNMDEQTKKNLEMILPIFADMRVADARAEAEQNLRDGIKDLLEVADAPPDVFALLDKSFGDNLHTFRDAVKTAIKEKDWQALLGAKPTFG
ncbi:hypothetical protein [Neorhizobium sp. LjRoot104]|uniref:hypothetical protein n=1 Tax=Neorhizobium sp. LjRoot104 TaxID=3342254 RepID=UPI003ECF663A